MSLYFTKNFFYFLSLHRLKKFSAQTNFILVVDRQKFFAKNKFNRKVWWHFYKINITGKPLFSSFWNFLFLSFEANLKIDPKYTKFGIFSDLKSVTFCKVFTKIFYLNYFFKKYFLLRGRKQGSSLIHDTILFSRASESEMTSSSHLKEH